VFYIGEHAGCFAGGLSVLCHKYVNGFDHVYISNCFWCLYEPLLPRFNPASAGSGVAVSSVVTFVSVFYFGGRGGKLSDSCHKCVTDVWKKLSFNFVWCICFGNLKLFCYLNLV
jgi:hypothetical protein